MKGFAKRLVEIQAASLKKPHGTRARYMVGCKCLPCRAANSRYETERQIARQNGDWNGLVNAKKARKHILSLSKHGVGRRAISDITGISDTIISLIKNGDRKKIRARTEKAILAVDRQAVGAAAIIPAEKTWKQINWLLDPGVGFTKAEIARRLGFKTRALQFHPERITMKTAVRVDRLYRQMHR